MPCLYRPPLTEVSVEILKRIFGNLDRDIVKVEPVRVLSAPLVQLALGSGKSPNRSILSNRRANRSCWCMKVSGGRRNDKKGADCSDRSSAKRITGERMPYPTGAKSPRPKTSVRMRCTGSAGGTGITFDHHRPKVPAGSRASTQVP